MLTRKMTLLFAVVCGFSVANIYFAQPLLGSIAESLNVKISSIGIVVSSTQIGYGIGLILIVPFGDLLNRRNMIIVQILISSIALLIVGIAPNISIFLLGMSVVGLMAVVVQVLVAYTAALSTPSEQGQAIGTVTSGVVIGILLARLISGFLADLSGWRSVYIASAICMLMLTGLLIKVIPRDTLITPKSTYFQILRSVFFLFFTDRILYTRGLLALFIFAAFSVLWTTLVLPLSVAPFYLSHTEIGLFGLAGIAGALASRGAGRWADQGMSEKITMYSLMLLMLSWGGIVMLDRSFIPLIIGIIMLDFAVQAVHVTNMSIIFSSHSDSQSRLIGAYMVFYSIGSAIGAIAATKIYAIWGWRGVCLLGFSISTLALVF